MARFNENNRRGKQSDNAGRPKRGVSSTRGRGGDSERKKTYGKSSEHKSEEDRPYRERTSRGKGNDLERKTSFKRSTPFKKRDDRPFRERDGESRDRKPFKKTPFQKDDRKSSYSERKEGGRFFKKSSSFKGRLSKPSKPGMRLNQFIAHAGICSRREADKYISAGLVTVNEKTITEMGFRVMPTDNVKFSNELIKSEQKKYLLLNKPKGYITTSDDPQKRKTVMELISGACKERLYPVGRLDRQTTGLLLFTNDGEMAKKLTNPGNRIKKIYHVTLDKNLTAADLKKIAEGLNTEEGNITVEAISYIKDAPKKEVGLELNFGRSGVVRRIFDHLEYSVVKLDRVYFGGLTKKDIPRGRHRFLTEKDLAILKMI